MSMLKLDIEVGVNKENYTTAAQEFLSANGLAS
jgi:hypothetical protein